MDDARTFLDRWHRIVAERDLAAVLHVLAPEIKLGAPPYWQPLEGRELVAHLLGIIITLVEDFTYHREWVDGKELALEFTGRIGKRELQGIDLISLGDDSRIVRFEVMIRPLNSLIALRDAVAPRMADYLAQR